MPDNKMEGKKNCHDMATITTAGVIMGLNQENVKHKDVTNASQAPLSQVQQQLYEMLLILQKVNLGIQTKLELKITQKN